ncbi:MAG: serine hydrolase [Bacteroidetes bacterium]|nr:MAG: serine hydrolase [Bacteroidota bacterium]
MKNYRIIYFFFGVLLIYACSSSLNSDDIIEEVDSELYFPPIGSDNWESKSANSLGWNENEIESLIDFLDEKNTKSFIMLHDGKIVLEQYLNEHTITSAWYWASAGKTLTSTISGIAQDEGLLILNDKVSDYLGTAWTNTPVEKENLITCKNLLSMNSGLDDSLGDNVSPENLQYLADAGNRWAYHNVYVKMQDVISEASNSTWPSYFNAKLRDKIGMSGSWIPLDNLSVYWSNTRSMARFGLLIYAKGKWETETIVSESFLLEATNTSQNINEAYGYLWWLNGKPSFHLPQSQLEFNGTLIPNAPSDMYAALGKNDQKIYIVPSKKLVIVRMGNAAGEDNFALSSFDNDLWAKINAVIN